MLAQFRLPAAAAKLAHFFRSRGTQKAEDTRTAFGLTLLCASIQPTGGSPPSGRYHKLETAERHAQHPRPVCLRLRSRGPCSLPTVRALRTLEVLLESRTARASRRKKLFGLGSLNHATEYLSAQLW